MPLTLSPEAEAVIAGLAQLLPVALGASAAPAGAYLVQFAPHISVQLATGQAVLMQAVEGGARSIAVNAQGQILGHGTLVPLTGLNPALVAAALWQVAAVATAQHYLVAMQRQLARVEAAVGALQDWLNDREVAGLVTSARYLQDVLATAATAQPTLLADRVADQIEQIARETAQVVEARRLALVRAVERVRALPLSDPIWWNVERNVGVLREVLAASDQDAHVGAMGLAVWSVALEARRNLADSAPDQTAWRRLAEARTQLAEAHTHIGELARSRADAIVAPSDLRRVLPNLQALVGVEVEAAAQQCADNFQSVDHMLALVGTPSDSLCPPASHNLIARRSADGTWALTPYRSVSEPAPLSDAAIIADLLRRLMRVPHLTLASLDDATQARARFQLRNGMSIRTWRNLTGFNHVFIVGRRERAIFGGFVPWDNRQLDAALREIWRLYG